MTFIEYDLPIVGHQIINRVVFGQTLHNGDINNTCRFIFATADFPINIAAGNDRLWQGVCEALGHPELAADPRFSSNAERVRRRAELVAELEVVLKRESGEVWLSRLEKLGVPCGPVYTMERIFSDPQTLARDMLVELPHPTVGAWRMPGVPIKFSETPGEVRTAPPLLGQHSEEILTSRLGYSPEAAAALRERGVV